MFFAFSARKTQSPRAGAFFKFVLLLYQTFIIYGTGKGHAKHIFTLSSRFYIVCFLIILWYTVNDE